MSGMGAMSPGAVSPSGPSGPSSPTLSGIGDRDGAASLSFSAALGEPSVVPPGTFVLPTPPPHQWRTLPRVSYETKSFMGLCRLPEKGDGSKRHFRRIDIKTYPREYLPFALLYFTGSDHHNRSMRAFVDLCGWTLSDRGLCKAQRDPASGELVDRSPSIDAGSEADVFAAIGLPYRAPHERDTDAPGLAPAAATGGPAAGAGVSAGASAGGAAAAGGGP